MNDLEVFCESTILKLEDFEPRWKKVESYRKEKIYSGLEKIKKEDYLSIAKIQRIFGLGYASATRLCDDLCDNDFIEEIEINKKRKINDLKRDEMDVFVKKWLDDRLVLFYFPDRCGIYDDRVLLKNLNGYCIYKFGEDEEDWHYEYADFVFEIIDYVTEGKLFSDWLSKSKEVLCKDKSELSMEDIQYYFRYIEMIERQLPGTIARELRNSEFMIMFKRYLELQREIPRNIEDFFVD